MALKRREIDMSKGSITKNMLLFTIPLMLSGALQTLYNIADNIVVGRYVSDSALGAVGATGVITGLLLQFFIGFSIGVNVLVSRAYGSGDCQKLNRAAHTSVLFGVISGVAIFVLGQLLCVPLLHAINVPKELMADATLYLRIVFIGIPAQMIYNFGAAILHSVGDTRRPLYILSFSGLVNVLLNLLLVLAFRRGVDGVAIATTVSHVISATLVLYVLVKSDAAYKVNLKKLKIYKDEAKQILTIGIPGAFQNAAFALGNTTISSTLNSYGPAAIIGRTAAANIENFVTTIMGTLANGTLTAVGQNYGAKKEKRVLKSIYVSVVIATLTGIFAGGLIFIFRYPLLGLFITDNPEAVYEGIVYMFFTGLFIFLMGDNGVLSGALRAMGHSKGPLVISLLSNCAFKIVWVLFVAPLYPEIWFVYLCWPIVWFVMNILYGGQLIIVWKKTMEKMKSQ